jgi:hypothetical protein
MAILRLVISIFNIENFQAFKRITFVTMIPTKVLIVIKLTFTFTVLLRDNCHKQLH